MRSVALAAAVTLVAGSAVAQERLVINSFGGAYEEAHRRLVIEPFEKMHNVEIEVVTLYSADALAQLRAQAASPQFDVIHFSGGQEVVAAEEGLLAPIEPSELTNHAALYPFAVEGIEKGQGPVYSFAIAGLIYDTNAYPEAPTSWDALFEAEDGEGVVIADITNTYGLLTLLKLNEVRGGDLSDMTPGLEAISELLDNGAQIVSSSPELQTAFAQGGATLAAYAQDYAFTLQNAGLPVGFAQPVEGSPAFFITANVVANRPKHRASRRSSSTSPDPRRGAGRLGGGDAFTRPRTGRSSFRPRWRGALVFGEEAASRVQRFDPDTVNALRPEWTDAWNRAIAR